MPHPREAIYDVLSLRARRKQAAEKKREELEAEWARYQQGNQAANARYDNPHGTKDPKGQWV